MDLVQYEVDDKIGYITLNRAEKRNALSPELVTSLKQAFHTAELDDQVKVIILRANGEVFCSGADLAYLQRLQHFSYEENLADSIHLKDLFYQIYSLPKIVIAQVQGAALAGGCGLATVCDFCFAEQDAKFGYTEVKIGFVPAIVMVFLLRKIGEAKARQLLLTGSPVSAKEAYTIGLVNCVSEKRLLVQDARTFARLLMRSNSSQAMSLTKKMIAESQGTYLREALDRAAELNAKARSNEDCKRGIAAFLAKQKTDWSE